MRHIIGKIANAERQEDLALLFELVAGLCAADDDDRSEFSDIAGGLIFEKMKEGSEAMYRYAERHGFASRKE